jgi:hypothetical protein
MEELFLPCLARLLLPDWEASWLVVVPVLAVVRNQLGKIFRMRSVRDKKCSAGRMVGRQALTMPADISIEVQPTVRASV